MPNDPLTEVQGREFRNRLERVPRYPLAGLPTPLHRLDRLARKVGVRDLWIKRDDLIDFGLGGNKVRGLELLIADILSAGCDTIVTGAGVQSNHVRATAAAACVTELCCRAVFWGDKPAQIDGNYRIVRMLGAESVFTGDPERASVDRHIRIEVDKLTRDGRKPYPIPRGGACALGALGHALAALEVYQQCCSLGICPDRVIFATGSGGTHAGWLLATGMLSLPWSVESFTVSRAPQEACAEVARLANEAASLLGLDTCFSAQDAIVHGGFIGDGYGIPTAEGAEAIRLVAGCEGVLLDPTYTGKAMAGLLEHISRREPPYSSILFLHTGGEPAFFAGDGAWLNTPSF